MICFIEQGKGALSGKLIRSLETILRRAPASLPLAFGFGLIYRTNKRDMCGQIYLGDNLTQDDLDFAAPQDLLALSRQPCLYRSTLEARNCISRLDGTGTSPASWAPVGQRKAEVVLYVPEDDPSQTVRDLIQLIISNDRRYEATSKEAVAEDKS